MKKNIVLLVIVCICCACNENEVESDPNSGILILDTLDVNSDGKTDFELKTVEFSTRDIPSSAGERMLKLNPVDGNLILYKPNSSHSLFLQLGDTIKKENSDNQIWTQSGIGLISKRRVYEKYDELWTVQSDLNEFYVAVKLKNDSIGWVKLDFDVETGEVYFLDAYFSNSDTLKIEN
jgi:hypothetical protein